MRKESGFSMLEVLVSMIVIMIGVLGIAGMQLMAINNTAVARYQSLAALLTSSMAAEIHGNVAYWGTAPSITFVGTTITNGPTGGSCQGAVCTATQMAGYTLQNWVTSAVSALPGAQGSIICVANTPAVCTLSLTWSEKTVASLGTLAGAVGTQSYSTMVTVQ